MKHLLRKLPLVGKLFKKKPITQARTYKGIESIRRQAGPVYYVVRAFFRAIARTQHGEVQAIGVENIPPDGSVLLVGNHPNSFLDYFNLTTVIRHPLATAAKDTLTNLPLIGPILRNHALMLPVARKMDQVSTGASEEERRAANLEFQRLSLEALVKGRLYNIFGEGKSTDSRKLNKIKLGFMALAQQAEREFNFRLNLRIVPYGFYYDRINQFQSSVCIIFGRPFKLRDLVELPEDFLALSPEKQHALEKKMMLLGKKRMQSEIESLIISIPHPELVGFIDDACELYNTSPVKYMGKYSNIREKYRHSKALADAVIRAYGDPEGRRRIERLEKTLSGYRKMLRHTRLPDEIVRREHTFASFSHHAKRVVQGLLYSPMILYGYVANLIPRYTGRLMRYRAIRLQKREQVDGDEQAIVGAASALAITYPFWGLLIFRFMHSGGARDLIAWSEGLLFLGPGAGASMETALSVTTPLLAVYLMGRFWRSSVSHGYALLNSLRWWTHLPREILQKKKLRKLREARYAIVDSLDFLIADYECS